MEFEKTIKRRDEELSAIGSDPTGGLTRLLYTDSWKEAQEYVKKEMTAFGMATNYDEIGNLFGRIEGSEFPEETILSGSHIDTVVNGGHLDGQFGVVAAMSAIEYLVATHGQPKRSLEVISMAEEEGSRFPTVFWGSKNFMGEASPEEVKEITDAKGLKFVDEMTRLGFDFKKEQKRRTDIKAFVELHIEQGNVLENEALQIGVVNNIVGQRRYTVILKGQANHDYSLYEGMKQIAKTGKVLAIHAENPAITDRLGEIAYKNGETTLAAYVNTRPVFTEVESIRRVIYLAKVTGCRIHICHIACHEGVEEVIKAREEGVDVTCETCTHYLYFTTDELDAIGPVVKCSPPIRDAQQQAGLWEHTLHGGLDFITSDHSPCTPDLKDKASAFEAWGGISGVQNNVDILFDECVQKRGLSLKKFADLIATNPADRFNLSQKGRITVGKDADFVLIKPNSSYTLKAEDLEYRNQISPYIGREIGAQVAQTILRGQSIYSLADGVTSEFPGEFIKK
ncbi:MAG: allantoinase AllB [Enterococcus lemanii]|jgi:dihydroorotase-like cyclic amidohydrolase